MLGDRLVTAIAGLVLAAHLAALLWLLQPRHRLAPLLAVNAVAAALILAYQGQRIRYILMPPADQQVLALIAFEALVLGLSLRAFSGRRLPVMGACLAFGLHLCAAIGALLFMLTFKMTRLF